MKCNGCLRTKMFRKPLLRPDTLSVSRKLACCCPPCGLCLPIDWRSSVVFLCSYKLQVCLAATQSCPAVLAKAWTSNKSGSLLANRCAYQLPWSKLSLPRFMRKSHAHPRFFLLLLGKQLRIAVGRSHFRSCLAAKKKQGSFMSQVPRVAKYHLQSMLCWFTILCLICCVSRKKSSHLFPCFSYVAGLQVGTREQRS